MNLTRTSKSTLPECDDSSDAASFPDSYDDHDMFGLCEAEGSCRSFVEADPRADEKEVEHLARKETTDVRIWRLVVMAAMVGAATLVSTGAYMFLRKEEENDFVKSYYLFTNTVQDAAVFHRENIFEAVRSLSEVVTAVSISTDSTFPFVTVPQFEVFGGHARLRSGIELVAFTPLISEVDKGQWQQYAFSRQDWIEESRAIIANTQGELEDESALVGIDAVNANITPMIWQRDPDYIPISALGPAPYAPFWQTSPPPFHPALINYNMFAESFSARMNQVVEVVKEGILSEVGNFGRLSGSAVNPQEHSDFHDGFVDSQSDDPLLARYDHPHSVLIQPIFRGLGDVSDSSEVVGLLQAVVPWDRYLTNLLPEGVDGITCVLKNTCSQAFTYELNGNRATYIGVGDFHEEKFDHMEVVIPFTDFRFPGKTPEVEGHCMYSFHLFPGSKLKSDSQSNIPLILTGAVASTFLLMKIAFFMYDRFVRRRNSKIVSAAAKSNAIVSSLFPSNVRDRLFKENGSKSRLKTFLNGGEDGDENLALASKPIADFFPETTILFMDIAGFTAWSSAREPTQVFVLLETLYGAFDEIAKKRRVFKVETIGDCYVAVTGLPDPRKDHAIAMARFARDCLHKMYRLTKKLERTLGPETTDLDMRIGLHSGPVTAGVLRGERSRFQLFGDTVNTASRMESNGARGRIQVSQETADLLVGSGKENWLMPRENKIVAKGKGELQTYWLATENTGTTVSGDTDISNSEDSRSDDDLYEVESAVITARVSRLIDWSVEVLHTLLREIVARRQTSPLRAKRPQRVELLREIVGRRQASPSRTERPQRVEPFVRGEATLLEEVAEIIALPEFDAGATQNHFDADSVDLGEAAEAQLYDYVSRIASLYRDNPFHNFEHAAHVTMSVVKLMSRIVGPSDIEYGNDATDRASMLHDHTNGITSDPLTQFACVFSALIHDVDHPGIPNTQLVKENVRMVSHYKGQSVAEQNSVDLAWQLLMHDSYSDLRAVIYKDETEMKRFRQLVVNSVMATDIMDKDLKALRNARWDKAFTDLTSVEDTRRDVVNRKATIVIEHMIQASDVAHTMQHWHIYCKWNKRLFEEMTEAFREGRAERDPAEFWYQGEIGFFDVYIIPLAKKLKDCGVFGVSSDEYLNYAMKNRKEWELRGHEIVAEMVGLQLVEAYGIEDLGSVSPP